MAYPIETAPTTFGRYLHDYRVHPDDKRATKPGNWDEIMDMVEQPRPDQARSALYQAQYEAFLNLQYKPESGRDVEDKIFLLIGGNGFQSDKGYTVSNLEYLSDANIAKVTPDYYDGADHKKIDKELLAELRTFVQPFKVKKSAVFPNFFAESKVPKYDLAIAEQQARYAGAIGSLAYHS